MCTLPQRQGQPREGLDQEWEAYGLPRLNDHCPSASRQDSFTGGGPVALASVVVSHAATTRWLGALSHLRAFAALPLADLLMAVLSSGLF